MRFLNSLFERVNKKYPHPNKKAFKQEFRMLGGDLVEDMLKDMEEIELISIEKSNGNISSRNRKPFEILK